MIRCVSCGDSRIASVLTTATTGNLGSMGGCVFTVSPRPSDSSDNPHFPAGGERGATGSRSAIQSQGHRAIWVVQSSHCGLIHESSDPESDPRLSAFPGARVRIAFRPGDTVAIGGPHPDDVFAGFRRREVVPPHRPDVRVTCSRLVAPHARSQHRQSRPPRV